MMSQPNYFDVLFFVEFIVVLVALIFVAVYFWFIYGSSEAVLCCVDMELGFSIKIHQTESNQVYQTSSIFMEFHQTLSISYLPT